MSITPLLWQRYTDFARDRAGPRQRCIGASSGRGRVHRPDLLLDLAHRNLLTDSCLLSSTSTTARPASRGGSSAQSTIFSRSIRPSRRGALRLFSPCRDHLHSGAALLDRADAGRHESLDSRSQRRADLDRTSSHSSRSQSAMDCGLARPSGGHVTVRVCRAVQGTGRRISHGRICRAGACIARLASSRLGPAT